MGTGEQMIDRIGDIEFRGKVGKHVAAYARATQRFGHDLAYELDNAATAAEAAMKQLEGHPLLFGIDVKIRAGRVAGKLRKAQELALAISAESVKFHVQYRQEFLAVGPADMRGRRGGRYTGRVDL
ncbi:hypothetical protein [Actinomadura terrae]|uniref:hypothetical protein n=1 Tax=Actinomadura terrae TaxID=604353 RepID=UPI001FA79262|nr:hypothetical protein [Actinomadura terrae]